MYRTERNEATWAGGFDIETCMKAIIAKYHSIYSTCITLWCQCLIIINLCKYITHRTIYTWLYCGLLFVVILWVDCCDPFTDILQDYYASSDQSYNWISPKTVSHSRAQKNHEPCLYPHDIPRSIDLGSLHFVRHLTRNGIIIRVLIRQVRLNPQELNHHRVRYEWKYDVK